MLRIAKLVLVASVLLTSLTAVTAAQARPHHIRSVAERREHPGHGFWVIDHSTRQLYNLLNAASQAGAKRCIYISSLELFDDYEENLTVTETWRSQPPTENVPLLACHLGEIVCKEYARDRKIQVATIRLGFPVIQGDRKKATSSGETAAVSGDDAIVAIRSALDSDKLAQWQDIHVQSPVPNQRYLMHKAGSLLDFPG